MDFMRRVDDLGRICIPKEIRKALDITEGAECKVNLVGNRIIISNTANTCIICNKPADIKINENRYVCRKCANSIKEGVENHD